MVAQRLRFRVAQALRRLATRIDGVESMDARWYRIRGKAMSRYILQVERYILALEDRLTPSCVVCSALLEPSDEVHHCLDCHPDPELHEPPVGLEELREAHHRFDTRRLVEAGWLDNLERSLDEH